MFGLETLAILHTHTHIHTCSPLEDAFARGLGAGLGSSYFKFLGMKLPCMWSSVKYTHNPM